VFAPAGTPNEIVDKLSEVISRTVQSPDFVQRMREIGNEAVSSSPSELLTYVKNENKRWGVVIKDIGLQLN
jgi:tripartite-type tricarboxylate transporter receptor subunit TctC